MTERDVATLKKAAEIIRSQQRALTAQRFGTQYVEETIEAVDLFADFLATKIAAEVGS